MEHNEEQLSRFMALVLRHKPEILGLELEEGGWLPLPDFHAALQKAWRKGPVTREIIRCIVDLDPKGRYEIDAASRPQRIRACYGHSTLKCPSYPETEPPGVLYHGTARRFLGRIWSTGLHPMGRRYVHLAADVVTARDVGARRDPDPVVLVIDAAAMSRDGYRFFLSAESMYLTESVPSGYLAVALRPGPAENPSESR